jgi:hypothetical protein
MKFVFATPKAIAVAIIVQQQLKEKDTSKPPKEEKK